MDSDNKWRTFPTDPRLETFPTDPRLKPFSKYTAAPSPVLLRAKGIADLESARVLSRAQYDLGTLSRPPKMQAEARALSACSEAREDGSDYRGLDGTADLQRAVDRLAARGGGLLWLPPCGDYVLREPLRIESGHIVIVGVEGATVVRPFGRFPLGNGLIEVAGPAHLQLCDLRIAGDGLSLVGLWLAGNAAAGLFTHVHVEDCGIAGVRASGASAAVRANGVSVQNCRIGFDLSSSSSARLIHCEVDSAWIGVNIAGGATNTWLADCSILRCEHTGLEIWEVAGFCLTDCNIVGNGRGSVATAQMRVGCKGGPAAGVQVTACYFNGQGEDGGLTATAIRLGETAGVSIVGNRFTNHARSPVWATPEAKGVTVVWNAPAGQLVGRPGAADQKIRTRASTDPEQFEWGP